MEQRYEQLETEKRNERTEHIDECTTLEILQLINVEAGKVAKAVEKALPQIVDAVEVICSRFQKGGHLIFRLCFLLQRIMHFFVGGTTHNEKRNS